MVLMRKGRRPKLIYTCERVQSNLRVGCDEGEELASPQRKKNILIRAAASLFVMRFPSATFLVTNFSTPVIISIIFIIIEKSGS